jgi:hypothetical protein
MEHRKKLQTAKRIYNPYSPPGPTSGNKFNTCFGWGFRPNPDYDERLKIIHDHELNILCRGIPERYEYYNRLCTWMVQNPDKPLEVDFILKGPDEGTGKNVIADMVAAMFGRHGKVYANKDALLGSHATNEELRFCALDEALFRGDKATVDLLKGLVTGKTRHINPKYISPYDITNFLAVWILSNHDIVLPAGKGARRHVIFNVSEEKADNSTPEKIKANREYFIKLHSAINTGGAGMRLHELLTNKLPDGWHPRQIIRTDELAEHQRAGMPSLLRWVSAGELLEEWAE